MPATLVRHGTASRATLATLVTVLAATLGLLIGMVPPASASAAPPPVAAASPNPVTPGLFTGLGFDQCEAPNQQAMTTWWKKSPFQAVGIYISGHLRFCQAQTHLTPDWVRTQLATGWRLLPIHLGVQATCTTRDRYQGAKNQIRPAKGDTWAKARAQGRAEAETAVAAATRLGITPRSTLFYDLEAFPMNKPNCQKSALWFLHAWTVRLHELGYVSGVYSSAASGIKVLDDARVDPNNTAVLPDQIWIADWNNKADDRSTYIRDDGWAGRRIHQYQGGHNETWGKVTINIDRNYLKLTVDPTGVVRNVPASTPAATPRSTACTRDTISRRAYRLTTPKKRPGAVVPLQCLLKQHGLYSGKVTGKWNPRTSKGIKAFQQRVGHKVQKKVTRSDWMSLLAAGHVGSNLRAGATHSDVVRVQRALNAARNPRLKVTGVYNKKTRQAVKKYRASVPGIKKAAVRMNAKTWRFLQRGVR